jgi:tetratricopeptide (TPR) repeat protein
MDKIPLRTYLKEIENLIDKGDNDQAIAHCRHILKAYPKNLATYRLLGKAYLESRRYGDAADVFQRVLSGTPDDFVSHVGMSIIREARATRTPPFWHMERAFEIQPYNSAIQDELRRYMDSETAWSRQGAPDARGVGAHVPHAVTCTNKPLESCAPPWRKTPSAPTCKCCWRVCISWPVKKWKQ